MGEALAARLLLQTPHVQLAIRLQLRRKPGQQRHPGLIIRRKLVGSAVQIEPHGTEGFAMVGEIDQPHVVIRLQ